MINCFEIQSIEYGTVYDQIVHTVYLRHVDDKLILI